MADLTPIYTTYIIPIILRMLNPIKIIYFIVIIHNDIKIIVKKWVDIWEESVLSIHKNVPNAKEQVNKGVQYLTQK